MRFTADPEQAAAFRAAYEKGIAAMARRDAYVQEHAIAKVVADGWALDAIEVWWFTDGRRFQIRERETESVLFDGELPPLTP